MEKVFAPFTPEQVESLNGYQTSGVFHPFTCRHCRDEEAKALQQTHPDGGWQLTSQHLLQATESGWVCPTCEHTQGWAFLFMADGSWKEQKERLARLDEGLQALKEGRPEDWNAVKQELGLS